MNGLQILACLLSDKRLGRTVQTKRKLFLDFE